MDWLNKLVMPTKVRQFREVLAATNAKLTEFKDCSTLEIHNTIVSVLDDPISSGCKALEVAFCAFVHNIGGARYMVPYTAEEREREVNDHSPGEPYYGEYKVLMTEGNNPVCEDYADVSADSLRDEASLKITHLPHGNVRLVGVDKDDMQMIAYLAIKDEKQVIVSSEGRKYLSQKLAVALHPMPYVKNGLDIVVNPTPRKELRGLAPGPEDHNLVISILAELQRLYDIGVLDVNMYLLGNDTGKCEKQEVKCEPSVIPITVSDLTRWETTSEHRMPNPWFNLDATGEKALLVILKAGLSGNHQAMLSVGLVPRLLSEGERRSKFGHLLSGADGIPKIILSRLDFVVKDHLGKVSYQTLIGYLALAVAKAVMKMKHLASLPDALCVAMLYFGSNPKSLHYSTGFRVDGIGCWPSTSTVGKPHTE